MPSHVPFTGLGFLRPGTLSEDERLLYLEAQIRGNIDLLKGIHSCLPFIPTLPFKVKMGWQDKGVIGRVVCGLWGHLFCRSGRNSLHMLCNYSMYTQCVQVQASRRNAFVFCWQRQQHHSANIKYSCLPLG